MTLTTLNDGQRVHCIQRAEARVLDQHVSGYFNHGVALRDGDIVLDVGANVGVFALRAVTRFPNVKVYAFEPVPSIFAALDANARDFGGGRLIPLNFGTSNAPGELRFTYFPRSPALSTSAPEVWEQNPGVFADAVKGAAASSDLWYARLVPGFLSGLIAKYLRGGGQEVVCPLRTLSQVIREQNIPRIDLLKVDCEGAELATLQGIEDEHWPLIRQVVAEVYDQDDRLNVVREMLLSRGLSQITIEQERGFEGLPLHNIFAVRPEAT